VPTRWLEVVLAATERLTEPLPLPLPPEVIVIHEGALFVAVQLHPSGLITVAVLVPPLAPIVTPGDR
jgi:hypothetical protein